MGSELASTFCTTTDVFSLSLDQALNMCSVAFPTDGAVAKSTLLPGEAAYSLPPSMTV